MTWIYRVRSFSLLPLVGVFALTACQQSELDPDASTLVVDKSEATADGVDRATVTVTLRDTANAPLAGYRVVIASTGVANSLTQTVASTDDSGSVTATLASTLAEVKQVTASVSTSHGQFLLPVSAEVRFAAGPAAALVFERSPIVVTAGPLPSVAVALVDRQGNLAPPTTEAVQLTLNASNGAVITGTTNQPIAAGSARFDDLAVLRAGSGYTLTAAWGLLTATSLPFDVAPAAASRVEFRSGPADAIAGVPLAPVEVALFDAHGNAATASSDLVTLTLEAANGASLEGTLTRTAAGGIATFDDLTIVRSGTDYSLLAALDPLASAGSQPFSIVAATPSPLTSTLSVWPPNVNSQGAPPATISITLKDAFGNLAPNIDLSVTASGIRSTVTPSAPWRTSSDGFVTGTLSCLTGGPKTVVASGAGFELKAQVRFWAPARMMRPIFLVSRKGAAAYRHLLWPHPASFDDGRVSGTLASQVFQPTADGGTPNTFAGTLANTTDYAVDPPARNIDGFNWAAGQRFQRLAAVENDGFGGFQSRDPASRALDLANHGSETVPSNAPYQSSSPYVVTRDTPWRDYGPAKYITSIEGGPLTSSAGGVPANLLVDADRGYSVLAAAGALVDRQGRATADGGGGSSFQAPIVMMGNFSSVDGGSATDLYGFAPDAPAPMVGAHWQDISNQLLDAGVGPAAQIGPRAAQQTVYGFTGTSPSSLALFRDDLIAARNLIFLGLAGGVVLMVDDDTAELFSASGDPSSGLNASAAAAYHGGLLRGLMADMIGDLDPFAPTFRLGNNVVIAFLGDTPRTGLQNQPWGEATNGEQNRTWVMANGLLKTGFFGGERPLAAGSTANLSGSGPGEGGLWDLQTGNMLPFDPTGVGLIGGQDLRVAYGETAMAAILYALTEGDIGQVMEFYPGPDFPALRKVCIPEGDCR